MKKIDRNRRSRMKKKIKRKKMIRLSIISVIIGYFLIRTVPMAMSSYVKTEPVTRDVFSDTIDENGLIVRNEIVYDTNPENIEFKKESGERVGRGEIMAVSKVDQTQTQEAELIELNREIELYTSLLEEYETLIALSEEEEKKKASDEFIKQLEEKIELKDESRLTSIRNDIVKNTDNNADYFAGLIENSSSKRDRVKSDLAAGTRNYTSDVPGIVSSRVDGLENKITPENMDEIDYGKYASAVEELKSLEKSAKATGIKLIADHKWYMVMELDNNYSKFLEDKTSLEVEFSKQDFKLTGSIKEVKKGEKTLILLEFNEGLHRLYDQRYVDVSLVTANYSGLKVPSSSITERKGTRGVFIKDISGIVRFVPVRVLYKGDDYSIVNEEEQGFMSIKEDGENINVRSLQVFDEVFRNSILVRENQVIN